MKAQRAEHGILRADTVNENDGRLYERRMSVLWYYEYNICYIYIIWELAMPKKALSVTLDVDNVLWLKGQMAGRRSLSDVLDGIVRDARTGGLVSASSVRSVVGTIDLGSDADLDAADEFVASQFARSLARPFTVKGMAATYGSPQRVKRRPRRTGRG
jgi:hypothetical protein